GCSLIGKKSRLGKTDAANIKIRFKPGPYMDDGLGCVETRLPPIDEQLYPVITRCWKSIGCIIPGCRKHEIIGSIIEFPLCGINERACGLIKKCNSLCGLT